MTRHLVLSAVLAVLLLADAARALPHVSPAGSLLPGEALHPASKQHHRGAEIRGVPGYKGELPSRHFGGYITVDQGGPPGVHVGARTSPQPTGARGAAHDQAWQVQPRARDVLLKQHVGVDQTTQSLQQASLICTSCPQSFVLCGTHLAMAMPAPSGPLQSEAGTCTTTLCSLSAARPATPWCSGSTAAPAAAAWTVRCVAWDDCRQCGAACARCPFEAAFLPSLL